MGENVVIMPQIFEIAAENTHLWENACNYSLYKRLLNPFDGKRFEGRPKSPLFAQNNSNFAANRFECAK